MRYFLLIFTIFTAIFIANNTNASQDDTGYICFNTSICPEYTYREITYGETCATYEVLLHNYCVSIDCSLTEVESEQVGFRCIRKEQCELKQDEYRTSTGDCIPCPSPGVFDNDTCNVCPEPSVYSVMDSACVIQTCSPGYELPHPDSTICYKSCELGYKMDVFGNCNKVLKCEFPFYESNGTCVKDNEPDPEPQPQECQTIISSINCLSESVSSKLSQATNTLGSLLLDVADSLGLANDTMQEKINQKNQNTNNNNSNNQQNVDTSSMNLQPNFKQITQQQLEQNLFNSHAQCPSDKTFDKWGANFTFSFSKLCEILNKLSYLTMLIAYIYSAKILMRS